jgi:phosphotransferase system IIA component
MVGPGVAIDPEPGEVTVVSPIAGRVVKVHPHAFVVLGGDGVGVLVHLGINTVRLDGQGFEVLTSQGSTVAAGDPMVRWDPATITGEDISTLVPVVAMDRPKGSVPAPAEGVVAAAGDVLFTVEA